MSVRLEHIFLFIYRIARRTYRILPLPIEMKKGAGERVVIFLSRIQSFVSSSRVGNSTSAPLCDKSEHWLYGIPELWAYDLFRDRAASMGLQNILFPEAAECAERVMIVLVPYHNVISGGIYSMFSIATHAKQLKPRHGWEVLVMTVPNASHLTYLRNRHFTNSIDVFRFSQILRLKKAKEIYIHIPEYAAGAFLDDISKEEKAFLKSRKAVYINILNQNIRLMPSPEKIFPLKLNFERVGQSVAHHAYCREDLVLKYKIDLMLLPAYTDLSSYLPLPLEKKQKLIIYSPDIAPHKKESISLLKSSFPNFELMEIRDITFDKYMEYASKCLFSITFGEGFDGYLAQPIQQGGIGFAVYNEEFFPSSEFLSFYNIFGSEEAMLKELPTRIKKLLGDPLLYKSLNSKLQAIYNDLYSKEDYIARIEKLCEMKYDFVYKDTLSEDAVEGALEQVGQRDKW